MRRHFGYLRILHPTSFREASLRKYLLPYFLVALMLLSWSTRVLANTVCPSGTVLEGVDVSHFNGIVDWSQVQASGKSFAFVAASNGLVEDPNFDTNYANVKAAGVIRGAYHFFLPQVDPAAQANLFLAKIGPLSSGDLPPVLDVEVIGGVGPSAAASAIQVWASIVEQATGRKPIIYTNASFWSQILGGPNFSAETLWVANFARACPSIPSTWQNWTFWQYTNLGFVPGITGFANLDRFNGSITDLNILAGVELKVDIRIKPDDEDGLAVVINPDSHGKTSVAILSTATFNASTEIVVASLTFGRTGNEQSLAFCNAGDVNSDGILDLVCHFQTALTGFQTGDSIGVLKGETATSAHIRGADSVSIIK